MAAKKTKAPAFTLVGSGMTALSDVRPAHYINRDGSRFGVAGAAEVIGLNPKGTALVQKAQVLLGQLMPAWSNIEAVVVTSLGNWMKTTSKRELAKLKTEHADNLEAYSTLPVWKKEGKFTYKGADVVVTHADLVSEYKRTWAKPTGKTKVVVSGNRRLLLLIVRNAIVRKAGFVDDIVTEIRCEERRYGSANARSEDSVFLNESGKAGKLESSKLQKVGICFVQLVDKGKKASELTTMFAGNNGLVQQMKETPLAVKTITLIDPDKAAAFRTAIVTGAAPIPSQGDKLRYLRARRMRCEHSNGHLPEFKEKGGYKPARNADGPWPDKKLTSMAQIKKHLLAHPELVTGPDGLIEAMTNLSDKSWSPTKEGPQSASSMPSTEITSVAAMCGQPEIEAILNAAGGEGGELSETVAELKALIEARTIYAALDDNGKGIGAPMTQADFNAFKARSQPKAKKKPSGRSKKSG